MTTSSDNQQFTQWIEEFVARYAERHPGNDELAASIFEGLYSIAPNSDLGYFDENLLFDFLTQVIPRAFPADYFHDILEIGRELGSFLAEKFPDGWLDVDDFSQAIDEFIDSGEIDNVPSFGEDGVFEYLQSQGYDTDDPESLEAGFAHLESLSDEERETILFETEAASDQTAESAPEGTRRVEDIPDYNSVFDYTEASSLLELAETSLGAIFGFQNAGEALSPEEEFAYILTPFRLVALRRAQAMLVVLTWVHAGENNRRRVTINGELTGSGLADLTAHLESFFATSTDENNGQAPAYPTVDELWAQMVKSGWLDRATPISMKCSDDTVRDTDILDFALDLDRRVRAGQPVEDVVPEIESTMSEEAGRLLAAALLGWVLDTVDRATHDLNAVEKSIVQKACTYLSIILSRRTGVDVRNVGSQSSNHTYFESGLFGIELTLANEHFDIKDEHVKKVLIDRAQASSNRIIATLLSIIDELKLGGALVDKDDGTTAPALGSELLFISFSHAMVRVGETANESSSS